MKVFSSGEGNVWKHVFEKEDAVYESVLYKYEDFNKRTVICCSTQSGCKVGCVFCGTGARFIRNLTADEIIEQVDKTLLHHNINTDTIEKFQIMFMSMGEPMDNIKEVVLAIRKLNLKYENADLLISTVGLSGSENWKELYDVSAEISKVGLQFSIHAHSDDKRRKIIPHKDVLHIRELRLRGAIWSKITNRQVYLNYCVNGNNCGEHEAESLMNLFDQLNFAFTFSVICSKDENMKQVGYRDLDKIRAFEQKFANEGYSTRIFDPSGQDDIGGGCGQLWFVQNWMKNHADKFGGSNVK